MVYVVRANGWAGYRIEKRVNETCLSGNGTEDRVKDKTLRKGRIDAEIVVFMIR